MNITTIVIQMTILLLIMIVGFVGAKKNIFNDEVNVYASNILLKIVRLKMDLHLLEMNCSMYLLFFQFSQSLQGLSLKLL